MAEPTKVQIAGQPWIVQWASLRKTDGRCIPADRLIKIRKGLTGEELVETLLHECMHGQQWHLDENIVEAAAKEMTELLSAFDLI
jgi:hypothetical protein